MNTTEILQGLKKQCEVLATNQEIAEVRGFNKGIDAAIAALGDTDLVKALEGLKLIAPNYFYDTEGCIRDTEYNAAIDRAIEIVENHGKK